MLIALISLFPSTKFPFLFLFHPCLCRKLFLTPIVFSFPQISPTFPRARNMMLGTRLQTKTLSWGNKLDDDKSGDWKTWAISFAVALVPIVLYRLGVFGGDSK